MRKNKCGVCGRELNGLIFHYGSKWTCSSCYRDKKDVLHCEKGCKVKCTNTSNGYGFDAKQAQRLLTLGTVYMVESVEVYGSSSEIRLHEFPNETFNTVHFERCS